VIAGPIEVEYHLSTHTKANSWWLKDAKGIELARVCDECVEQISNRYPPEVLGLAGRYEDVVDEQIDDNY
jgi:hypothetical protein